MKKSTIESFTIDNNDDDEDELNETTSKNAKPIVTITLDDYEDNDLSIDNINEPLQRQQSCLLTFWNNYYALILVFLSGFGFSIQTIFVKLMANDLAIRHPQFGVSGEFSFEFCFYRGLLQFALSLSIIMYNNKQSNNSNNPIRICGNDWRTTLILTLRSLFGFGGVIFSFLSVECLPVGDSTTLVMLSPLFATLFSFCILGEPLHLSFIVASVCSLIGLILIAQPESIFGTESSNPNLYLGVTLALLGALSAGGAYVCVRMLGLSGIPWYNVTFVQSFGQIFLVYPSMWIYTHGKIVAWDNENLLLVLLGGTIGAISQAAMTVGMQRESSARATSMRMSDVLFGYIFQFYLTKSDKLSVTSLFGAILITSSIIIVIYFKPKKDNNNSSTSNTATENKNNDTNNNNDDVKIDTKNPIIEMIASKKIRYTSLQQSEDEDKEIDVKA